jgi:hypothetical protein
MDFSLDVDDLGRLVATLSDANGAEMVTALHARRAAADLEHALAAASTTGHGECVWPEFDCSYRWILRVGDGRLAVTVMSSSGTLTGWRYVFGSESDHAALAADMHKELTRLTSSGVD